MNARISPIRRLVVPALLFLLYTPAALAMGDNSPSKQTPDCPSGQAYDSVSQKCVPQKTSSLSDEDKTNYAWHLAKKANIRPHLTCWIRCTTPIRLRRGTIAATPPVSSAEPMKELAIISGRWR